MANALFKGKVVPPNLKLFWRNHTPADAGPKRVWREDWCGDQFEVLEPDLFEVLKLLCKQFTISLEEAED